MIKNIKHGILSALILTTTGLGVFIFAQPLVVNAQADLVCDGLTNPGKNGDNCNTATYNEPQIDGVLENVLDIISMVAGIIAVIMIIIAATRFMTSQGDAGKVASARTTIIYAVIGLIIVALAQAIVFFVLDKTINTP